METSLAQSPRAVFAERGDGHLEHDRFIVRVHVEAIGSDEVDVAVEVAGGFDAEEGSSAAGDEEILHRGWTSPGSRFGSWFGASVLV